MQSGEEARYPTTMAATAIRGTGASKRTKAKKTGRIPPGESLGGRLMPWVRGGSRPRTETHAGGGCRTRLDTCIGTEARKVWVSQWAPVQGTTSAMPLTSSPVSPLLKSIPGPFLLIYLQKRSKSSLTGAKGSKYLRNATVETAGDPAKVQVQVIREQRESSTWRLETTRACAGAR